jgi:L-ascorbate metabolism protein UlaG (beta-lactamase superfamily)
LGGASFYLKSKNKKIIIDPYLTNSVYDILKPFFNNPEKKLMRLKKLPV